MKVEFAEIPKFPMATAKQDGFTYSVTDLRYLNQVAGSTFIILVEEARRDPDATSVIFDIPEGTTETDIRVISDILMGVRYEVKKRSWGKLDGCLLVGGIDRRNDTMTVTLHKDHVKAIHEFMRGKDGEIFSLIDFVRFLGGYEREKFTKAIKEEKDE